MKTVDLRAEYLAHLSSQRRMAWIFSALYLLSIVGVNAGFSYLPVLQTNLGPVPAMAFIVGCVFILRDYAQRYAGHWVLALMWVGLGISMFMADPHVALASGAAFLVSEVADWLVYTLTKKPFHQRMLISSVVAVPLDSGVFLLGIGVANPGSIVVMSLSKLAATLILYSLYKALEDDHAR